MSFEDGAKHCFKKKFTVTYIPQKLYFWYFGKCTLGSATACTKPKIVHIKRLIDVHNHKNSAPNSIFNTFGLLVNVHKQKCNNGQILYIYFILLNPNAKLYTLAQG